MGRISFGDVIIACMLTALLFVAIAGATGSILYVWLGFSANDYLAALLMAADAVFIVGGTALAVRAQEAGYPVLRTWVWGAVGVAVALVVFGVAGGVYFSFDVVLWVLLIISELVLALFFAVGLAATLNARFAGMTPARFRGTRPGGGFGGGITIYKSNAPAIYEGVKELDFDDKAPGSILWRRQ